VSSAELSVSWSLFSSWSVEALISPNNCDAGHCTRSVDDGATSVGALHWSGNPLPVEWSERVSTSSSVGGAGAILNLRSAGKSVRTSVLVMQRCINCAHCWGFWRTCTIALALRSYPAPLLILAHCVHLVSLCLSGASASCVVISGASSPLVGEGICRLWLGSISSLVLAASSCAVTQVLFLGVRIQDIHHHGLL
jgi:hypothetical protein